MAEDGGEKFVVKKVTDVATGHFAGGGGSTIQTLGTGAEGVCEGGAKDRGGQLEQAGAGDEKDAEQDKFLRVADFLGKKEKKTPGDENHWEEIRTEAEKKE